MDSQGCKPLVEWPGVGTLVVPHKSCDSPARSDGHNSWQVQNRKNFKFAISIFRVVMIQCSLGPAPNAGIFQGIARKINLVSLPISSPLLAQGEPDARLCGHTILEGITLSMGSHRERCNQSTASLILFAMSDWTLQACRRQGYFALRVALSQDMCGTASPHIESQPLNSDLKMQMFCG